MLVSVIARFLSDEGRARSEPALVDVCELLLGFGNDAEGNSSVQRHGIDLDVEALAILVGPCGSDAGEKALLPSRSRTW
jgi:hypothetical protein